VASRALPWFAPPEILSLKVVTFKGGRSDGEYVVIQFDTQFENKAAAVETIAPMHEKDGSWRVSGYFIK
jgi:hypothetical protein